MVFSFHSFTVLWLLSSSIWPWAKQAVCLNAVLATTGLNLHSIIALGLREMLTRSTCWVYTVVTFLYMYLLFCFLFVCFLSIPYGSLHKQSLISTFHSCTTSFSSHPTGWKNSRSVLLLRALPCCFVLWYAVGSNFLHYTVVRWCYHKCTCMRGQECYFVIANRYHGELFKLFLISCCTESAYNTCEYIHYAGKQWTDCFVYYYCTLPMLRKTKHSHLFQHKRIWV